MLVHRLINQVSVGDPYFMNRATWKATTAKYKVMENE